MSEPIDTVNQLVLAINRRDVDTALGFYEPDAVLVIQPGQVARGAVQLRDALEGFAALEPTLESEVQHVIQVGDVALYLGRWTLRGTDPGGQPLIMGGESTDTCGDSRMVSGGSQSITRGDFAFCRDLEAGRPNHRLQLTSAPTGADRRW